MDKLEYVVPPKQNTNKTPFCMSSGKFFLKCCLHYNHFVEHSDNKPVDNVSFQKIKSLREGDNEKINIFEIDICYEGVLDKQL